MRITTEQRALLVDLCLNRITDEEYLRRAGISRDEAPQCSLDTLIEGERGEESDDVSYGLLMGFRFGFLPEHFDVLCRLSDAEWHGSHEDIVSVLDEFRDRRAVDTFYRAALALHPYLDYDEARALATKAIWGLGNLGDASADEKLRMLAQSGDKVVWRQATKQLKRRMLEAEAEARRAAIATRRGSYGVRSDKPPLRDSGEENGLPR